jgi:hypothetical protein
MSEDIRTAIAYNPDTGVFTWAIPPLAKRKVGDVAGYVDHDGYRIIGYGGRYYKAHRIAWYLFYNKWPSGDIDHINGNPGDNRIINLRDASRRENCSNTKRNRAGHLVGTTWRPIMGKWQARIQPPGGRTYTIGYFNTDKEAHEAYIQALSQYEE